VLCLDQDSNSGLNIKSKIALDGGFTQLLRWTVPSTVGRLSPSFLEHRHFDVLPIRTVNRTVITVQKCYDGVIAQP